MKNVTLAGALVVAVMLSGCANVTSAFESLTGQTQSQVTTFAEAEQSATVATQAVDVYVTSANPDAATLTELKALNDGVHAALTQLAADQAAGKSLTFGAFNAALDAFNAYAADNGAGT